MNRRCKRKKTSNFLCNTQKSYFNWNLAFSFFITEYYCIELKHKVIYQTEIYVFYFLDDTYLGIDSLLGNLDVIFGWLAAIFDVDLPFKLWKKHVLRWHIGSFAFSTFSCSGGFFHFWCLPPGREWGKETGKEGGPERGGISLHFLALCKIPKHVQSVAPEFGG